LYETALRVGMLKKIRYGFDCCGSLLQFEFVDCWILNLSCRLLVFTSFLLVKFAWKIRPRMKPAQIRVGAMVVSLKRGFLAKPGKEGLGAATFYPLMGRRGRRTCRLSQNRAFQVKTEKVALVLSLGSGRLLLESEISAEEVVVAGAAGIEEVVLDEMEVVMVLART